MTIKPNAFENEIFEAYRKKAKKIDKAVKLLKNNGYYVSKPKT